MMIKNRENVVGMQKVCKKCGDPLRSTNKHKYCDNCIREKKKKRRKVLGAMGAIGSVCVVTGGMIKHYFGKK